MRVRACRHFGAVFERYVDLRLESAVKTLYELYDNDGVPMQAFTGVTLEDLHLVETTCTHSSSRTLTERKCGDAL